MATPLRPTTPEYIQHNQQVLEDRHSDFQHIVIAEDPDYGRLLYLDDDLQISEADQPYNQAMVDPLARHGSLGRVLILGGGDGGVLREAISRGAREAILVDIDRAVIDLCRRYLPQLCGDAFDAPQARVVVDDALAWLHREDEYDGIIYDLTMEPFSPDQSRTRFIDQVLAHAGRRLRPGGTFSMQCCGANEPALREEIRQGLARRFRTWEDTTVSIPSYDVDWVFAWARHPRLGA
ncbi:methyltransferase domain-containing protein [Alkalilimnicola ehrlichii MLHE-1]|uniref:Polyamine aminopropyltransferase n=1 Tax=Alkalilimnicola ehrlichii (strain ATCC BAA-1101 / DSM 17681 / MLHE-1) TaxID=187272 RepID=Q0ABU6_ALKEH|nr:RsmD family RNA methyltransferase [Alkalilimnicola ehrlichii]ABI55691.1 spermine synthase [Alkalilimnicola ehrlichii MLHE-1]